MFIYNNENEDILENLKPEERIFYDGEIKIWYQKKQYPICDH